MNKLSGWDDTIVALATVPGVSALGVVRLSGKNSFEIVNQLFKSKNLNEQPSHTIHVGYLREGERVLDEVVLSLFRGPRSYTGEDVVEISCHGSMHVLEEVMVALVRKGARMARPGEFTQRAFINGRMDLVKAESVGDLIASRTEAARKTAINNMRGGFSRELQSMREQLIRFSALIELELDFATEDVEFANRDELRLLLDQLEGAARTLADSFRWGNVIKNGISVAIVGKPNAGKSTLLNRLLHENRAIVSATAGTTRDTIEEALQLEGMLFRFIDTAGIRSHTIDDIERQGIEKSMEKMRTADIVIYLFDVNTETEKELEDQISVFRNSDKRYMLVANKCDTGFDGQRWSKYPDIHFISAEFDKGIEAMLKSLQGVFSFEDSAADAVIVTNLRHYDALRRILRSIADIRQGMLAGATGDLLAADIRQCLFHIGEITGEVTNEDRLDFIFSKFCIGK